MSQSKLDHLIQKRATLKTKITKFRTNISKATQGKASDIINIKERLADLSDIYKNYEIVQDEIELLDLEQVSDRDEFEDNYYSARTEAKLFLEKHSNKFLANEGVNSNLNPVNVQTKLPALTLPTFNGNRDQWQSFYETFTSIIHNEPNLTKIQKLHYLQSCVTGEAAKIIKTLSITHDNYDIAFESLVKRYDNKSLQIKEHVSALFNLSEVKKPTACVLRNLIDKAIVHIKILKNFSLPTEHWDVLLIHLIFVKLDFVSKREWENSNNEDIPKFTDFCEFIYKRSKTMESLEFEKCPSVNNSFQNYRAPKIHPQTFKVINSEFRLICCNCNGSHFTNDCEAFKTLSVNDRLKRVQELRLCKNCLKANHPTAWCKSMNRCKTCKKRHHSLLHFNDLQSESVISTSEQIAMEESSISNFCNNSRIYTEVLLSTAVVETIDSKNNVKNVRLLLDAGSQSNFICYSTCAKLNLTLNPINHPIVGISNSSTNVKHSTKITIKSRLNSFTKTIDCLVLFKITNNLPITSFGLSQLEIPKDIKLADNNFNESSPIDILIGAELFWEVMQVGQIKVHKNQPYFQKTVLGWIVGGNISPKEVISNVQISNVSTKADNLDLQLRKFWEIEQCDEITNPLTPQETACEQHFKSTFKRTSTGRYIVRLPFKENNKTLGDSKQLALKRFYLLERKLNKNVQEKEEYTSFLFEYLNLGHMEIIPSAQIDKETHFYLPHHPVYKSATKKLRVVFDGSARTSSGLSLNDTLHVGPTIQNDLFTILIKFRTYKYTLCADISKMFRQILVNEEDRDFQRIFWRDNHNEPIREYRLKTVTYGLASSPYLAIRSLHQLVEDHGQEFNLAPAVILQSFYVDDVLTGAEEFTTAIKLRDELISLLRLGGFELRQWSSNVPSLLPESNINLDNKTTFDDVNLDKQETKILGINWNCKQDTFRYSFNSVPNFKQVTKRTIVSAISSLYDPLGLISPLIINSKILIQKLWSLQINWDESVPIGIQTEWEQFISQLSDIADFNIKRNINPNYAISHELHGFSDASQKSYGACIYLRTADKAGNYTSNLVCAKSRVAPLKSTTIPRLELCAALLLINLMQKTKQGLGLNINKVFYWTDSSIVLSWLAKDPNQWKTFVANRVAQIQTHSTFNQWFHIESKQNPADIVSRGTTASNLKNCNLWWEGPSFLKTNNISLNKCNLNDDVPEQKRVGIALVQTPTQNYILEWLSTCSNFNKLARIISYINRFSYNCKNTQKLSGNLTYNEIKQAKIKIFKIIQEQSFAKEIHSINANKCVSRDSKLLSLNPFVDNDGLLRVGGRLKNSAIVPYEQKHPIILPAKCHVTKILIINEHIRLLHSGPLLTLASLRENYWPLSARNIIRQIVHNCVKCFRTSPKSYTELMGNLPKQRVEPSRPYLNCGLDYAGPVLLKEFKGRGKRTVKAYIVIFVCFATRAIHIELALDLTADAFINALKRFISRRGHVQNIYSDNSTTFVGANNHLFKLNKLLQSTNKISDELLKLGITWHFIPPGSPSFGGLWEAAVKSCKIHLKRTIGTALLTYDELYTLLVRIEACLNSRPITSLSSDPNDLSPLTPGHFLIGGPLMSFPETDYTNHKLNTLSRWQYVEHLRQVFWKRWVKEYLNQFQIRNKWKNATANPIKINDLVLIKEDNLPPLQWSLGRIIELHPGTDGYVRTVSIRTKSGIKKRAITKICVLPNNEM